MNETCVNCKYFLKIKWTGSVCTFEKDFKKKRGNCKGCENYQKRGT